MKAKWIWPLVVVLALTQPLARGFIGFELGPLLELVSGQVQELERMGETLGIAKEQYSLLVQINRGIDETVSQIHAIETIIERAKGLDPRAVKSLSELNDLLRRAKEVKVAVEEVARAKAVLADEAITQSALQSDTAYKMGQEMVAAGSSLALESQTASPGRAEQITASAASAQMLAQGVELQTLSQLVQLQAMSLDFQKSEVQRKSDQEELQRSAFESSLAPKRGRK